MTASKHPQSIAIGEIKSPVDTRTTAAVTASVKNYELNKWVAQNYPTSPLGVVLKPGRQLELEREVTDAEWLRHEGVIPREVLEIRKLADAAKPDNFKLSCAPPEEPVTREAVPYHDRSLGRVDLLVGVTALALLNHQIGLIK